MSRLLTQGINPMVVDYPDSGVVLNDRDNGGADRGVLSHDIHTKIQINFIVCIITQSI